MFSILIPISSVIVGLGLMVCFKLYNDKIKSIIVSHDQIQIDFKHLRTRLEHMELQDRLVNDQNTDQNVTI